MPYRILKPPPDWLDLQQVEQEADRLIAGRNLLLRFPPALEWLFQDERSSRRRGQLVHTGLIALLVFDLFLVGDYLLSPQSLVRAVVVRFGIITPVTLLSLWMLWRFPVKTRIPEWLDSPVRDVQPTMEPETADLLASLSRTHYYDWEPAHLGSLFVEKTRQDPARVAWSDETRRYSNAWAHDAAACCASHRLLIYDGNSAHRKSRIP